MKNKNQGLANSFIAKSNPYFVMLSLRNLRIEGFLQFQGIRQIKIYQQKKQSQNSAFIFYLTLFLNKSAAKYITAETSTIVAPAEVSA